MPRIGIIAGSGFYDPEGVTVKKLEKVSTPFGSPSDEYRICEISGREVAFLSRHGSSHRIPPHRINYRANLWGFKEMGVERVFAVNAVGGMKRALAPGDIVIPDQIVDMTSGRESTFYNDEEVVHIDFTMPYCRELREIIIASAERGGIDLKKSATYVCVNGPRLETRAEIQFFSGIGDIVGMTGMPEACLARELEMCFAGISVVTNLAAGISTERLTAREVVEAMKISMGKIRSLLTGALDCVPAGRSCECSRALKDSRI